MAMIKCPECSANISDKAKKCPHCGNPIKKVNKKIICILVIIFVTIVLLALFVGMMIKKQNSAKKVSAVNEVISQLVSNKAPSQSEYDNAIDLYNELTDNEKSNVLNADVLTKYNDVNLNAVSQLNTAISKITLSTTFSELLNIKNSYDNLNENGKQFIDIKPVENAMQLTDLEKAAVVAAKYIKKSLKSMWVQSRQIKEKLV